MARYKDVEGYRKLFDEEYKKTRKLISEGETHLDNLAEGFSEASRVIDCLPTVDVVPKSEVDELEAECERQYEQAKADILANMADGGTSCHWCIDEHKAKARAEVAREIFAYIEQEIVAALESNYKVISKFVESDDLYYTVKGKISALRGIEGFVEELKKKYLPQECPTCAHFAGCEPSTLGVCEEYKENRDE